MVEFNDADIGINKLIHLNSKYEQDRYNELINQINRYKADNDNYVSIVILVNIQYYFCVKSMHFNYLEMSKNKNTAFAKQTPYNRQISLDVLYTTDNLTLIKKSIAGLTKKQDYKTLNTLFRRNPNASKFDTRTFNEDVPQENKRFTNRNGKSAM